ncbi:hypothetical protein HZH66_005008 [Vespula vulgaris]|uniref:Uncharacterized protein n=1 Tax=Vespula vulgaris TaxID=7454 RepID=A0A834K9Q3_VESVU|nr:hypothetical protein HZH66_005008 [Vespula vulgaris]
MLKSMMAAFYDPCGDASPHRISANGVRLKFPYRRANSVGARVSFSAFIDPSVEKAEGLALEHSRGSCSPMSHRPYFLLANSSARWLPSSHVPET